MRRNDIADYMNVRLNHNVDEFFKSIPKGDTTYSITGTLEPGNHTGFLIDQEI